MITVRLLMRWMALLTALCVLLIGLAATVARLRRTSTMVVTFPAEQGFLNNLYVIDVERGKRHDLTQQHTLDGIPVSSPSGLSFAFVADWNRSPSLRIMRLDGFTLYDMPLEYSNSNLVWSPDGNHLLYDSGGIHVMDTRSGETRQLFEGTVGQSMRWSPDSEYILLPTTRFGSLEIYTVRVDGSDLRNLTHHASRDEQPQWSPDGEQIVFVSDRSGNWEIYMMDAAGDHLTNMTNSPTDDISPQWSPNGETIAFITRLEPFDYDATDSPLRLALLNTESGEIRILAEPRPHSSAEPLWSPDGHSIAYIAIAPNQCCDNISRQMMQVNVIDVESGTITHLTPDDFDLKFDLSWSPDSEYLAMSSFLSESTGISRMQVISVGTGMVVEAIDSFNIHFHWRA